MGELLLTSAVTFAMWWVCSLVPGKPGRCPRCGAKGHSTDEHGACWTCGRCQHEWNETD